MNEKFFDLKKEKQDRMINASLKIFALEGYDHASTDDIVKEAGISKGLLFHYFISKLGLYSFIYDYSVRYLMLELNKVSQEEKDYFKLYEQIKYSELQVMKNYPYMLQFINKSKDENVSEALLETEDKRNILPQRYVEILAQASHERFRSEVDAEYLTKLIGYTMDGLMSEQFRSGSFQPENYYEELCHYLDMLRALCYQEEG